MKKAFALVLAVAMIASMAVASFAANEINATLAGVKGLDGVTEVELYKWNSTTERFDVVAEDGNVAFGTTVYVCLIDEDNQPIKDKDVVSGVKVSAKWSEGAEYVKSTEIVKKGGIYMIAIATTGHELDDVDVSGTIALGGKTVEKTVVNNEIEKDKVKVDVEFDVDLHLAYNEVIVAANAEKATVSGKAVYDFEENDVECEEFEFTLGDDITVVTNIKNVDRVFYSFNTNDNDELIDAYVDADLLFYNCNMTFRRTAEVTLEAEEGSYLYEVVDGELVAVDADYDEWEEAFVWNTRKLGNYVVSDVELEVAEEVVATNPTTGAAA